MAKNKKKTKGSHFLREWREFRGMTQEELAAAVTPATKPSVISLLETGERGISNKWLERLAPVLRTKKGFILDLNPNDIDNAVLEIWVDIPDEAKPQAKNILETFRRKAG